MAESANHRWNNRIRLDLTEGPIMQRLVTLAWPLFVGNILNTFYNLADMYWVSGVGTEAVAAVAMTYPTVWLTFSFGLGVTIAGSTFVAQYTGAGQHDEVGRTAGQVVLLACVVAVFLGSLGILLRKTILTLMGATGEVLELGSAYLLIVLSALPFNYIYLAYRSVSQGSGNSKTPRNLLLLTTLLNVILDPFLIHGWLGLPALGVVGAAWATWLSMLLGAVLSLLYLASGRLGLRLRPMHFLPDWSLLRRIAALGLPGSLDMGARGVSSVMVAGIVSRFGPVEAAAYGLVNRLMSVVWTSSGAMEQAAAAGVGQNLGANTPERAERVAWVGAGVMFAFLTAVAMLLYVFAEPIIGVFHVSDEVASTAARFLRLHVFSFGFWGALDVVQGAFRGAGQTVPPAVLTFAGRWLFQIPLAIAMSYRWGYGANGYWIALPLTNVLFFFVGAIWFRAGRWKQASVLQATT
jgi:putative MATE family efflux protein